MSLDQKRNRANEILREMGFPIVVDNWSETIVDVFLDYNDEKDYNSSDYVFQG